MRNLKHIISMRQRRHVQISLSYICLSVPKINIIFIVESMNKQLPYLLKDYLNLFFKVPSVITVHMSKIHNIRFTTTQQKGAD